MVSEIALAEGGDELASWQDKLPVSDSEDQPILPLTYAQVIINEAPVYAHPSHATIGLSPARSLRTGYLWVSLADAEPIYDDGQDWYLVNQDEYVRADHLAIYEPSTFQGVALPRHPDHPFAWLVFDTYVSTSPAGTLAKDTPLLSRYALVTIYEEQRVGDWIWYRIGENQWIEQRAVGVVKPSPRPGEVGPDDKWIEINLYEQTLAAYEGDRMVYATLVSSGLPWWQTKKGLFRIWIKVKLAKMSGRESDPNFYFLEDVPWTMYFYQSFALHAAYWHDRFGLQHSRGCVNLAPRDAVWLFEWASPVPATNQANWTPATAENPGTWVWVHE
jgi:hypothetical protein